MLKNTIMENLEAKVPKILSMWNKSTLKEIGLELGISSQRISQIVTQLRKHGLPIPSKKYPKIDWEYFVQKYKNKI